VKVVSHIQHYYSAFSFTCQEQKVNLVSHKRGVHMLFGEKIRNLRKEKNLSQEELALKLGVTRRSILNYETKSIYPKNSAIIGKMSEIFEVSTDYLLSEEDNFIIKSKKLYGDDGKNQAENILNEAAALFAGGSLSEDDKLAFVHQIQKIYFDSKKETQD